MLQLAGHLGKSLREIEALDCEELAYWIAFHRFFRPLNDPWQQTGVLAVAALAPYSKKGKELKPSDFIPTEKRPQQQSEMLEELRKLKMILKGTT
jgi:hypothetical protein